MSLRFRKAGRLLTVVVPQSVLQVEVPLNNDVWAMGTTLMLGVLGGRTCELGCVLRNGVAVTVLKSCNVEGEK